MFSWWSDVRFLRELLRCAEWEGAPLAKLEEQMGWGISFSSQELNELKKFLQIFDPLEVLFSSLDSDTTSNIQKVYPSIQVFTKIMFAKGYGL